MLTRQKREKNGKSNNNKVVPFEETVNFKCKCGKEFAKFCNLQTHQRIHEGENSFDVFGKGFQESDTFGKQLVVENFARKPFKCKECGKDFQFSKNLAAHGRFHDTKPQTKNKLILAKDGKANKRPIKEISQLKENELERNNIFVNQHSKYKVSEESFGGIEKVIKLQNADGNERFTCHICGKTFISVSYFMKHLLTHGQSRFKCQDCGKMFYRLPGLKRHRFIHSGERPFGCGLCDRRFYRKEVLKQHSYVHTGEKPYQCDICGKAFRQSGYFAMHRRIHTGEKPYKCDVCDDAFTFLRGLKHHYSTKH